nr:sialate O-acetylesterase [Pyrinomonadaceae bacterium]
MRRVFVILVCCWILIGWNEAVIRAEVKPHSLFSDGMVLQQKMTVPVWGMATTGERVTVEFQGQKVSATAGQDGKWTIRLKPLRAGGPFPMTISGENKIQLGNVLVGEVWLCSGQSNMEWS